MTRLFIGAVIIFAAVMSTAGADDLERAKGTDRADITHLLDGFHQAAAHGQRDRYLNYFTADGVFMGTDDWERWPLKPDFEQYVTKRFKDGRGWTYKSVERHIAFAPGGKVAWFDEITKSEKWGLFRGTGVVLKQKDGWKLAHYAMSVLIPNEVWTPVSDLAKAAVRRREAEKK